MHEKAEKKFNIIIKGLDLESKDPVGTVVDFISSHFNLKNIKDEISNVTITGKEGASYYLVILKSMETKNLI